MKFMKKLVLASAFAMSVFAVNAAETSFDLGADVVSQYVWRGVYQGGGVSVQPGMGYEVGGLSIGAWGSVDIAGMACKELDFTIGYSVGGFSIAVTDYWWNGQSEAFTKGTYFDGETHLQEVALGYEFGESFPLSIGVATFVAGDADVKGNGDQAYSTYISLGYPFAIAGVDCGVAVGMSAGESSIYCTDGFDVTNVSLSASKEIALSPSFSLPVFAELSFAPATNDAYLVIGLSF